MLKVYLKSDYHLSSIIIWYRQLNSKLFLEYLLILFKTKNCNMGKLKSCLYDKSSITAFIY